MIVVTSPIPVNNEAAIINQMFYAGLELLHIRKPDTTALEVRMLIESIDSRYHERLALHQYHEMASDYGIHRLHYKEAVRRKQTEEQRTDLAQRGFVLSTSVHNRDCYNTLSGRFNYAFIGPLFNSISKKGYGAMEYTGAVEQNNDIKRIAIGGISKDTLNNEILRAFDGIAILGAIWLSEEPLQEFKLLQQTWNTTGRHY